MTRPGCTRSWPRTSGPGPSGGQLLLVMPGAGVLRIFEITGLDQVIPHVASLEEALAQPPQTPI